MTRLSGSLFAAVGAAFLIAGASLPAQAGHCVKAGGKGIGITKELAKMASATALKDSLTKNGWKAAGKAKTSCTSEPLLTTCVTKQRACK